MSQIFTSYEQELITNLQTISKKITSISVQSNQKKQLAFTDIREDEKECQNLIKMMETELSSLDVQIKFQYSKKMRQYKKDLEDCRKKLNKQEDQYAFEKNREMLIGAQLDEEKSSRNREKLLKQGQMLSDTNSKLKDSVRTLRETEDMSHNIEIQLVNHSGKIKQNKQKLIQMRDDIRRGEKSINSIVMRIRKHKFVMLGVIVLILVIAMIAIIVHFSGGATTN